MMLVCRDEDDAHRRRTATVLGFLAVVFFVIGAAGSIDRIPAVDTLHAPVTRIAAAPFI